MGLASNDPVILSGPMGCKRGGLEVIEGMKDNGDGTSTRTKTIVLTGELADCGLHVTNFSTTG